jgi:hypothetical protein
MFYAQTYSLSCLPTALIFIVLPGNDMVASPLEQLGCMGVTRSYVDDLSGNQAATTCHQVPDSHSGLMHSPGFDGMYPANRFLAIRRHAQPGRGSAVPNDSTSRERLAVVLRVIRR